MTTAVHDDTAGAIACDLIALLHQGAPAEDFATRLARVEKLPDDLAAKPGLVELVRMAMAVRHRLELQQHRERGMLAVIESAQDLSSRLDLTSLLRAIVSRARNLLGSHVAWLSTYDLERQAFQVLVADGAVFPNTPTMAARRHLGVASVVMSTRQPFATPDYLHDNRFPHDPALDDTFRNEGIHALVGVPLTVDDEVMGLLFVADRYHRTHTASNTSVLCTLATHAAVALKNARAFEQARSALEKAELARTELERHARNMHAAAEAHEQMTSLLARGASLSALCQSVAQFLDGSLLVLDEAANVIGRGDAAGYPGTEAQAYVPHGERSLEIADALRHSRQVGRSVVAYQARGEVCRAIAVIGGNDVLGAVLLFRRTDLDEMSVRTFERSTSIVGIVLLSQERAEAAKSRDVATLLRALVSSRQDEPALLVDRAQRFGLDLSKPLCLIVVEMDDAKAAYAARRLRAGTQLPGTVFDEIDGVLAVVCGATRAGDVLATVKGWAKAEFGSAYRGVLSSPIPGPTEIPALYATLRRALSVLARMGVQGHIVGQNEMALYSTLFETHDRGSLDSFLRATLGVLIAQDEKRGSDLTRTLLTYFDCNQNAKTTAQRLNIHVNTVRQRLGSIEELLGHWGNAVRALEIHMALRLWSLCTPDGR